MNIFEIIGRLLITHNQSEDIYANIGSIIDKIILDTKAEKDDLESYKEQLASLLINLQLLETNVKEYKDSVLSYIETIK